MIDGGGATVVRLRLLVVRMWFFWGRRIMPTAASLPRIAPAVLAALVVTASAFAQTYPSRVIKIIVPFAVGGQPDTIARVFAQHLAATIGATIIDNRPG